MLYIEPSVAVPWNGLASVTEAVEGGDAQPYYLDGQKILNTSAGEDFGLTLEGFGAPDEFYPCAGNARLSTGLYAADQTKVIFDFSYRTMVGNDLEGLLFGYKIHLVYNATAKSADYTYSSDTETPSVKTYSWDITTYPATIIGYRPTSHFIFDTRFVGDYVIGRLENILYGSADDDPRMPTVEEVISFLTNASVSVWYDLTGLSDFPAPALVGDMGVDFTSDDMYGDGILNYSAYWWDLTGDLDFPAGALIGDWGYDTVTGQVWSNSG
jgi:hypothetical protein